MARIFPTLTEQQRQYLSESASGNRQVKVLNAILSNWNDVEDAIKSATESVGSADRENAKYLNSIEGKTQKMASSFQSLSNSLIDSGWIKGLLDTGTGVLNFLNLFDGAMVKVIGYPAVIMALAAALKALSMSNAGQNFIGVFKDIGNIPKDFKEYGNALLSIQKLNKENALTTEALETAVAGLTAKQKAAIAVKQSDLLITQYKNKEELAAYLQTLGLTQAQAAETAATIFNTQSKTANAAATGAQTAANTGLLGSIRAVTAGFLAQAAAWLMTPMGMATVAVGAIMAIAAAYKAYNRSIEEGNQLIRDRAKAAKEELDSITELTEKYEKLKSSSVIDDTVRSEIRDVQQEITKLVGQQAGNLDLVNGNLDSELEKLKKINIEYAKRASEQAYSAKILAEEEFKKKPTSVRSTINPFKSMYGYTDPIAEGLKDSLGEHPGSYQFLLSFDSAENLKTLDKWQESLNEAVRNGKDKSAALRSLGLVMDEVKEKIKVYNEAQSNMVKLAMESSAAFYTLTESQKSFIEKFLFNSNLNNVEMTKFVDKLGGDHETKILIDNIFDPELTEKSIKEQRDTIIKNIMLLPNEMKQAVDESMDAEVIAVKLGLTVDIDEASNDIKKLLKDWGRDRTDGTRDLVSERLISKLTLDQLQTAYTILSGINDEQERANLGGAIAKVYDNKGLIESINAVKKDYQDGKITIIDANDQIEASFSEAFDGSIPAYLDAFLQIFRIVPRVAEDAAAETVSELKRVTENFDKLQSAIDKIKNGETLSNKDIFDFVESGQIKLSDVVVDEAGFMSVPVAAFQEGIDKIYEDWNNFIDAQKAGIQEELRKNQGYYNRGLIDYETFLQNKQRLTNEYNDINNFSNVDFDSSKNYFKSLTEIIAGLNKELNALENVGQNFQKDPGDLGTREYDDFVKSLEKAKNTYPNLYAAIMRYNASKTEENAQLVKSAINYYSAEEAAKKAGQTYKDNVTALRELNSVYTDAVTLKTLDAQKVQDITDKYPALAAAVTKTADGYTIEAKAVAGLIEKYKELTKEQIQSNKTAAENAFRAAAGINVEETIKNIAAKVDSDAITSWEQYAGTLTGHVIPGLKEFIEACIKAKLEEQLLSEEIDIQTDLLKQLNDELNNIKSAYNTVSKAIDEYNEKGYISVDTLQELLKIEPKYLDLLIDEQGNLLLTKDALIQVTRARINELAYKQADMLLDMVTKSESEADALEKLKLKIDEVTGSLIQLNAERLKMIQPDFGDEVYETVLAQLEAIDKMREKAIQGLPGGLSGGGSSKSSSSSTKPLDYSNLYNEQLKDLEKRLEPLDRHIDSLNSKLTRATALGDEDLISQYTADLIKAQEERKAILEQMLTDTRRIVGLISSTFKEFANVDMSDYGIAKYRQNLSNQITDAQNGGRDTKSLEATLTRFNEYVSAYQAGQDRLDAIQSQIDKSADNIFAANMKEADRQSQILLKGYLEEWEKRAVSGGEFIANLEELLENSAISGDQREKIQDEIAKYFDGEYARRKTEIAKRKNLLLPDDFEGHVQIALENVKNAEEAIAKARADGHKEGSALMDALQADLFAGWTEYYTNAVKLAEREYDMTGNIIPFKETLLALLKEENGELVNKLEVLNAIDNLEERAHDRAQKRLENEAYLYKQNAGEDYDPQVIIDIYNKKRQLALAEAERERELLRQSEEYISGKLTDEEIEFNPKVMERVKEAVGYLRIVESEVADVLQRTKDKISYNNFFGWDVGSEIESIEWMLDYVEDLYRRGIISYDKYIKDTSALDRELHNAKRKVVDEFIKTQEDLISYNNYWGTWNGQSEKDVYKDILDGIEDYRRQGMLSEKDSFELREKYARKFADAVIAEEERIWRAKQKAAIKAIDAEIEALQELTKQYDENIKKLRERLDLLNEQKNLYDKAAKAVYYVIDKEIEKLNEHKKILQEANKEQEKKIELAELEERLKRARENRNIRIYREDGQQGFVWEIDQEELAKSEKAMRDFRLQEQLDAIDLVIQGWQEYRKNWEQVITQFEVDQNKLAAAYVNRSFNVNPIAQGCAA